MLFSVRRFEFKGEPAGHVRRKVQALQGGEVRHEGRKISSPDVKKPLTGFWMKTFNCILIFVSNFINKWVLTLLMCCSFRNKEKQKKKKKTIHSRWLDWSKTNLLSAERNLGLR